MQDKCQVSPWCTHWNYRCLHETSGYARELSGVTLMYTLSVIGVYMKLLDMQNCQVSTWCTHCQLLAFTWNFGICKRTARCHTDVHSQLSAFTRNFGICKRTARSHPDVHTDSYRCLHETLGYVSLSWAKHVEWVPCTLQVKALFIWIKRC